MTTPPTKQPDESTYDFEDRTAKHYHGDDICLNRTSKHLVHPFLPWTMPCVLTKGHLGGCYGYWPDSEDIEKQEWASMIDKTPVISEDRVAQIFIELVKWGNGDPLFEIMKGLIAKASEFFSEYPDDFCVHDVSDLGITFGKVNRLEWSPRDGWSYWESDCTDKFIAHFHELQGKE